MVLQNKVAIITGGSRGIGAAAAKLFAAQGAKLVLGARSPKNLDLVIDGIRLAGGDAIAVYGDVQDEAYSRELVNRALDEFGGLDIAFNNAGVLGEMGDITSLKAEDWETTLRTNLTSGFYASKYQLPAMLERGSGSIIFTSSFVGHTIGLPGMAAYAASKAGLIGMMQCLATEYGSRGIRINALLPGGTDTDMAPNAKTDPEAANAIAQLHALKRMASPIEIAKAALFLASDASSFVTGSAMLADGGNSITKV